MGAAQGYANVNRGGGGPGALAAAAAGGAAIYILETALVLLFVYIVPALAVRPQFLLSPVSAAAIPFISILMVFAAVSGLKLVGLYSPAAVHFLTGCISLAAIFQVNRIRPSLSRSHDWRRHDLYALAAACALGLYVLMRLLEGGFDEGDEMYSWNLWAIQHYLGLAPDYHYTQAPYPQLFPKLLSYSYMLLGTIEAQTSVKTSLVVFPISIFFAIGLSARKAKLHGGADLAMQAFLCLFLMKAIRLDGVFDNGMPDALAAAAVGASFLALHFYQQNNRRKVLLYVCASAAIVAALSKQSALLWALFSLPALLILGAVQNRNAWRDLIAAAPPVLFAIVWMLTEGRDFQANDGVLVRSMAERDLLSQLAYALNKWLFDDITVFLLIAWAAAATIRNRGRADALLFFALPSVVLWFLYAAYDLRAATPALTIIALAIASAGYGVRTMQKAGRAGARGERAFRPFLVSVLAFVSLTGGFYELRQYKNKLPRFQIGNTAYSNLFHVFEGDIDLIYNMIRTQNVKIWASTNHVYGLFYGYIDVIRPDYTAPQYNERTLMNQIRQERPDFLTNGGTAFFGPGGKVLDRLASQSCPDLFTKIAGPDNKFQITVYRLEKRLLDTGYCSL